MLYEIHMLKNYPPTNLNRDDTGAPKSCTFGGAKRGRISSQCLKRSWRLSNVLSEELGEVATGTRTRRLPDAVCEKLLAMGMDEQKVDALREKIPELLGLTKESKKTITKELIFYSPADMDAVVSTMKDLLEGCKNSKEISELTEKSKKVKEVKASLKGFRPVTLDIALFGRMVTTDTFEKVEASMQVAHAISTNKVTPESDYFTAMDDLLSVGEVGAGMIQDVDFNSSCYYVYASIDTDALVENLKYAAEPEQIVRKAIPALLRAMAFTNPSGKQNSFAGHVLPSVVMVECKEQKIPTSMVNAFVEPVGKGGDLVQRSAEKLASEVDMVARNFGLNVKERLWFCVDKYDVAPESATRVCASFPELVEAVSATM